jgi:hypothetical protein
LISLLLLLLLMMVVVVVVAHFNHLPHHPVPVGM